MLHNDISNKQAPIVVFNLDNLLYVKEEQSRTIKNILNNFISNKLKVFDKINKLRDFDKSFINKVNNLWLKHNVCIYLVSFSSLSDEELYDELDEANISYTKLIRYDSIEDLRDDMNRFFIYFDNDLVNTSIIGEKACHIDRLNKIF